MNLLSVQPSWSSRSHRRQCHADKVFNYKLLHLHKSVLSRPKNCQTSSSNSSTQFFSNKFSFTASNWSSSYRSQWHKPRSLSSYDAAMSNSSSFQSPQWPELYTNSFSLVNRKTETTLTCQCQGRDSNPFFFRMWFPSTLLVTPTRNATLVSVHRIDSQRDFSNQNKNRSCSLLVLNETKPKAEKTSWPRYHIHLSTFTDHRKKSNSLITSRHSRKLVTPTYPRCKWTRSMRLHGPGKTFTWAREQIWCSCFFPKKKSRD